MKRYDMEVIIIVVNLLSMHIRQQFSLKWFLWILGFCCPWYVRVLLRTNKYYTNINWKQSLYCCSLGQPAKSSIAKHSLANADHNVLFEETKILFSVRSYFAHLHIDLVQIQKYVPIAMNQQGESMSLMKYY